MAPSARPVNRPDEAAPPVFFTRVSCWPGRGAKPSVIVPSVTPVSVKAFRTMPMSVATAKVGLKAVSARFAIVTSRSVAPMALVATAVTV